MKRGTRLLFAQRAYRAQPSRTPLLLASESRPVTLASTARLSPSTSFNLGARSYASPVAAGAPLPASVVQEEAINSANIIGPSAQRVRTVLTETARLLQNDVGGSANWYNHIEDARLDLEKSRRGRLAVIGDKLSGAHDVVSALLQDPLSDSDADRAALLNRYFGTGTETLNIQYGATYTRAPGLMSSSASWLKASGCDVVEVEANGRDAASALVSADAVVVVLDPYRLAAVPALTDKIILALAKGKVHFVVNGALPPNATEGHLRETLLKQITNLKVPGLKGPTANYDVTFVRAEAALGALDALSAGLADGGNRARAFDVFQKQFIKSNMGILQGTFLAAVPADYQLHTAAETAQTALAYTSGVIASDRKVLDEAAKVVAQLRSAAVDGAARAKRLSVVASGITSGVVEGSVDASIANAKQHLKALFDGRLSWLGLVARLRVDDVGSDVGGYISRSFGSDVEQQLIYEAGQLQQLQYELGATADKTARQLTSPSSTRAGHPFSSPLLINHLQSLALSVPPVSPAALTAPVTTRKAQLLGTAVNRLQVSAQRSLLTTYSLALLGISSSWCATVPPLELISDSTGVGLGALSAVSAMALGQTFWARAEKRWWKDWDRVTAMLKDDLVANYDKAVEALVLARPRVAADGLDELVAKREERLSDLEGRLASLSAQLGHPVEGWALKANAKGEHFNAGSAEMIPTLNDSQQAGRESPEVAAAQTRAYNATKAAPGARSLHTSARTLKSSDKKVDDQLAKEHARENAAQKNDPLWKKEDELEAAGKETFANVKDKLGNSLNAESAAATQEYISNKAPNAAAAAERGAKWVGEKLGAIKDKADEFGEVVSDKAAKVKQGTAKVTEEWSGSGNARGTLDASQEAGREDWATAAAETRAYRDTPAGPGAGKSGLKAKAERKLHEVAAEVEAAEEGWSERESLKASQQAGREDPATAARETRKYRDTKAGPGAKD